MSCNISGETKIISLKTFDHKKFEVFTSPLYLAIAFYFTEKKNGNALARKKIGVLAKKLKITIQDASTVKQVINNKGIHDFEDGLEYYSAKSAKCKCIITEDKADFYFADMEVIAADEFLLKYLVSK